MDLPGSSASWLAPPIFAPVERPAGKALLVWPGRILKGPVLGAYDSFLEFVPLMHGLMWPLTRLKIRSTVTGIEGSSVWVQRFDF